ncbi:hypothetical protein NDU88_001932 [Pleurodeles waltl]|uniref:Uncharacterized protein n=1 Tax=Pleurodeles waltl TaxID=8319 RepID=A0AAV7NLM0_PLEWA|nr:hypothetical protein NDU88_001932 [Pleurodeles waltl]
MADRYGVSLRCWSAGSRTRDAGRCSVGETAPTQARGRGSAPSAGPLSLRCTAGPPVLRSESLHGGRRPGKLEESPRPFTLEFFCLRRADCGAGVMRLHPPGSPLLPRRAASCQGLCGRPFPHGSGARRHQKSSDARQGVCFGGPWDRRSTELET